MTEVTDQSERCGSCGLPWDLHPKLDCPYCERALDPISELHCHRLESPGGLALPGIRRTPDTEARHAP